MLSNRPSKRSRYRLYQTLLNRDGPWCHYCGVLLEQEVKKRRTTIDHVQPVIYGGTDSLDNLVLACYSCNQVKDDLPVDDKVFQEYLKERINTINGHREVHGHEAILFTRQGNWSCLCGAHGSKKDKPKNYECPLIKYGTFYRPAV